MGNLDRIQSSIDYIEKNLKAENFGTRTCRTSELFYISLLPTFPNGCGHTCYAVYYTPKTTACHI